MALCGVGEPEGPTVCSCVSPVLFAQSCWDLGAGCSFTHLPVPQLSAVQQWPHNLGQAQENSRGAPWLCGCVLAELLFIAHCWPQLPSLPALSHCCGLCSAGIPEKLLRGFAVPADWAGAVDYVQRDADYLQNHKCTNGGMRMPLTGMNLQVWADKEEAWWLLTQRCCEAG